MDNEYLTFFIKVPTYLSCMRKPQKKNGVKYQRVRGSKKTALQNRTTNLIKVNNKKIKVNHKRIEYLENFNRNSISNTGITVVRKICFWTSVNLKCSEIPRVYTL